MKEVGNYETAEVYKLFIEYLRTVDNFLKYDEEAF